VRIECDAVRQAVCFDPQTSGGLLAAVDPRVLPAAIDAGFMAVGAVQVGSPGVVLG
jgi:hypothetical protein